MEINKGDLLNSIKTELSIQEPKVPNSVSNGVSLVYPVNRKFTRIIANATATHTASTTIYTTQNDPNTSFYLTFVTLSFTKDVGSTGTYAGVKCYVNGEEIYLLYMSGITGTVCDKDMSLCFPHPVKVDNNTAITLRGDGTAVVAKRATIGGFYL